MSEYTIETRKRSRSKTPFLRSVCDHENCEHLIDEPHTHTPKKKVTSQVKTIVEETVEVTSSSSGESGKSSPSKLTQTKMKTSDYSSGDSPVNTKKTSTSHMTKSSQQQQHETSTETRTSTKVISRTTKASGGSVATSTPKVNNYIKSFAAQFVSRGAGDSSANIDDSRNEGQYKDRQHKEHTQNLINAEKEINSSKNKSLSGFLGRSYGSAGITFDAKDHMAYLEYKEVGEYWKNTPKTDYTYSELSPHRREIAPGVIAMPNMSRQSLDNHHARISYMVQRNPAEEEHIRRRYESPKIYTRRYETDRLAYDSGDEVYDGRDYYREKSQSWLVRLITTIINTVTTTYSSVTGHNSTPAGAMYRHKGRMLHMNSHKGSGFFGSIARRISLVYLAVMRNIYLFISSVMLLDNWLLQSQSKNREGRKRFLLLLLILLPLLLLAAWWLLDEKDREFFAQRWHSLVPLSLITTLRSSFYTNFHTLNSFLPLFASSSHSSTSQNRDDLQRSLSQSMPSEDYENILNHIDSYIQKLVDIKLQEQQKQKQLEEDSSQLSSNQIETIVQIIKENVEALSRQKTEKPNTVELLSSDSVLNMIVDKVTLKLQDSPNLAKTLILSPQNVEQIKQLVAQAIESNNSENYKSIAGALNVDALIEKLVKAPLFTNFLKTEVSLQLEQQWQEGLAVLKQDQAAGDDQTKLNWEQQKLLIANLNKDIDFIKLALNDKLSENEDLHYSVKHLQQTQDVLLKRLQDLETSTDQKLNNLLQEINVKLATLQSDHFQLLNQQVKLSLIEILGFQATTKDGSQLSELDLQNWVRNTFVAKDYLELRLAEINNRTNDKIKQELDKSGMFLMRDISERLKQEIIVSVESRQQAIQDGPKGEISSALSEREVRNIVQSVLAIYDADKTGLVDFALESAGGQILSTRCTENYHTKTAQISVFGIPLWYPTNTPRIAISPNVQPGECWAFQGFPGFLVLKLNSMVYVTGFTLEHIPKSLAPNGRIDSAPRNFTVWGLEHEKDQEPILFGEYEYADNGASWQYFSVQNKEIRRPYEIVELRIESNHGHPLYTCLYRFRVHGKPPAA